MKKTTLAKALALTVLFSSVAFNASASTKSYVDEASTTASVMSVLAAAKSVPATDIKVTTYKHMVQLSGFVDAQEQVKDAEKMAKNAVRGIKVRNDLQVKTKPENAATQYTKDAAITTKIKAKLAGSDGVSATDIGVNTYNGVVQLSGFVDSQAAVDKAGEIAKNTDGASKVVNSLITRNSVK